MSFFGMGGPPKMSSAEKLAMYEMEVQAIADQQARLNRVCQAKCIPDYREGSLNKGEAVCLDRCTSKFFETQKLVSEAMQTAQNSNAQQQQPTSGGFFG